MAMHGFSIWVSLLLLFLSLILLITKIKASKTKKKLPPGPPKLPIIGNLHLLGSLPHRSLCKLSTKYGAVMFLKLGSVPTIVVSSAAAAKEVLKVHDLDCCTRPPLPAYAGLSYNYSDISFSPYGDHWREIRKICVFELFSSKRVLSFRDIREEEIGNLINSISQSSSSIDLREKVYSLTASIINRVAFGRSFGGGELDNENFEQVIHRAMLVLGGFSATNFFPSFGWIIDWLTGFRRTLDRSFNELDSFFQRVIDDRLKSGMILQKEENIVDVLLKMERDRTADDAFQLTRDCIKAVIMDIFLAGVETGASTIVWAMTELAKNQRVMKKVQDEIRSCIKEEKRVRESNLEQLQYLKMVIREALRLHPPLPLLLPREAMNHFKLYGYDIDPKTQIYVNVWAIGRDPDLWKNPDEFWPERFDGSSVDYKGQHFELLPFGAGRRSCPGMAMGEVTVEVALANLLLCYDWKLPKGMKEEDVEMEEDSGLTITKKSPLQLVPIPYFS